jgi:RNA polymerase sigma-B factor
MIGRTMGTHRPGIHSHRAVVDECEQMLRSYRYDRRPEIRDRIAESFEWLVVPCVRRARWHDEPIDDLAQVARMGLLAAIERFDPARGVQFRTFAEATMIGALRHHQRSSLQVKVPRSVQHLNGECRSAVERLTASLGRMPTTAEVADAVGIGRAQVREALAVDALFHPISLSMDESGNGSLAIDERLCTHDSILESTAERAEVYGALAGLSSRQRMIVFLHFYEGRTQAEIGARLGISQVQVSRLMKAALETLRDTWSEATTASPST